MIQILFTVDVEIWCESWTALDREFPDAFRRYIYGPTASGQYGLRLGVRCPSVSRVGVARVVLRRPFVRRAFRARSAVRDRRADPWSGPGGSIAPSPRMGRRGKSAAAPRRFVEEAISLDVLQSRA